MVTPATTDRATVTLRPVERPLESAEPSTVDLLPPRLESSEGLSVDDRVDEAVDAALATEEDEESSSGVCVPGAVWAVEFPVGQSAFPRSATRG